MDEQQSQEFAKMVAERPGELLADFDPAQYPCQLLAQMWYAKLAERDAA
jgi:hypothetical protein